VQEFAVVQVIQARDTVCERHISCTTTSSAGVAPIAIAGVALGIASLFRQGQRKVQGVLAIVLGAIPSAAVFGIPATLDSFF
jgi:ABC-type proline/glycine betaine transport system permease subunit